MHRGIVHDSGSGMAQAPEPRIAKMYIFPHAWEILLNRFWGIRPVHSITFENPIVPRPQANFPLKHRYSKGEVYKVRHYVSLDDWLAAGGLRDDVPSDRVEIDHLIESGINHFTGPQIDLFLMGRLMEVLDYKDQTRLRVPKLVMLFIGAILLYAVAWIILKSIPDFIS